MSEPYSALAQVTIDRADLISYLDASARSTAAWVDWERVGAQSEIERVDGWLAMGSYRYQIRRIMQHGHSIGRFCRYDDETRIFTFGTFFFSEELRDVAHFCAVARGIAPFLGKGAAGFAAVDRVLWGGGAAAVLDLQPGGSELLVPGTQRYAECLASAERAFEAQKSAYAVEQPEPIDQLDQLRKRAS